MNGQQIARLMRSDKKTRALFGGVFSSDEEIPSRSRGRLICIVNEDPASQPGIHWIAVERDESDLFFDSYGRHPRLTKVAHWVSPDCAWNQKRLQDSLTTTCGQWCLLFAWIRARNFSLEAFQDLFGSDHLTNDELVNGLVEELFDVDTEVVDEDFLCSTLQVCKSERERKRYEHLVDWNAHKHARETKQRVK